MSQVITIGLDIAKNVFHAHGADERGTMVFSRKLARSKLLEFSTGQPACLVALEACSGAHHWARQLQTMGHEVQLIPPAYVKPFVKRNKNDAIDAEAIAEAAQRPGMRFVAVKSEEQQAAGLVFRTRDLTVRQRTQLINAIRGHPAEYGWVAPTGRAHMAMLANLNRQIAVLDREIGRRAKEDDYRAPAAVAAEATTAVRGVGDVGGRRRVWHNSRRDEAGQLTAPDYVPTSRDLLLASEGASADGIPRVGSSHRTSPFVHRQRGGSFVSLRGLSASGENVPEADLKGLSVRFGIIPSQLAAQIPFCCWSDSISSGTSSSRQQSEFCLKDERPHRSA